MGKDAITMGIITEAGSYNSGLAGVCSSVFFGNCLYEIFPSEYERNDALFCLRPKQVVIYDEKGLCQSWRKSYECEQALVDELKSGKVDLCVTDAYRFYPGTSYKIWHSHVYEKYLHDDETRFQYKYQAFYQHVKSDTVFFPIDNVAESVMTAVLYDAKRREKCKEALARIAGVQFDNKRNYWVIKGSKQVVEKAFIEFVLIKYKYDYPAFVRLMRNKEAYKFLRGRIKNLVFITMREGDLSADLETLHMGTRSYMTELVHGKSGSLKFIEDMPAVIYPKVPILTSKSWKSVELKEYGRADVLESYDQQGMCFVAKVKNPYSKQKINLGSQIAKVVLIDYNKITSVATYRLASSVVYDNDMENLEVM